MRGGGEGRTGRHDGLDDARKPREVKSQRFFRAIIVKILKRGRAERRKRSRAHQTDAPGAAIRAPKPMGIVVGSSCSDQEKDVRSARDAPCDVRRLGRMRGTFWFGFVILNGHLNPAFLG